MAIKLSGPLSFDSDIVREFISDNAIPADFRPHSLSEYYRLGEYVPDATANDDIPLDSSVNPLGLEEIKFSDFYGAVNEITFDVADFLRQFPTGPERAYDAVPGNTVVSGTAYVGPQPGVVPQPANKVYVKGRINVDLAAKHPYVGWTEGTPLKILVDSDVILQSNFLGVGGGLYFNNPTVTPTTWDGGVKIDNDGVHLGAGGNPSSSGGPGYPAIAIPSNLGPNINEFINRSNGKFYGGGGGGKDTTLTLGPQPTPIGTFPGSSATAKGGRGQGASAHSPNTGLNPYGRGGNAGRTYTQSFPTSPGAIVNIAYATNNDPQGGNNLTPGNPGSVNPAPPGGSAAGVGGGWGSPSPGGGTAGNAINGFTYMGPTVFVNTAPTPSSLKGGTS